MLALNFRVYFNSFVFRLFLYYLAILKIILDGWLIAYFHSEVCQMGKNLKNKQFLENAWYSFGGMAYREQKYVALSQVYMVIN